MQKSVRESVWGQETKSEMSAGQPGGGVWWGSEVRLRVVQWLGPEIDAERQKLKSSWGAGAARRGRQAAQGPTGLALGGECNLVPWRSPGRQEG